ncbi:regulator of Vps4 activity in the MVB pathway-domain-containing protein [Haematococcus lacustris]
MFSNFNVFKAETKCKLGLARIKLQRNKRNLAIKQLRKEVAELLRTGKLDSARIRVEGVIRENLMMQACDTLELYLELVTVRSQQIAQTREVPSDLTEAISSIIYAAARVKDIQELGELKIMFAAKYGKEYVNEAGNDATCRHWQVNEKLVRCLLVEPPQPEDKLATLSDIAQEAGIEWDMAAAANDMLPPGSRPGDHPPPGMPPTGPRGAEQARGPPPAFAHPEQPEAQPGQRSPPPDYAQPPPGQVARNHTAPYGFTPGGPPPPFMDPQQAAAAAAAAAAHARAMADYAAQLAVYQQAVEAAGQAAPEQLPPDMPPPVSPQRHRQTHSQGL